MKPNTSLQLRIADENLNYRDVPVAHSSPTGAQILDAAGVADPQNAILLQVMPDRDLEEIRPAETPDLSKSLEFIMGEGDRAYFFIVDDARLEWPSRHLSGVTIRKLSKVPDERDLLQVFKNGESAVVEPNDMVNLAEAGVERFVTAPHTWKLRVQGVTLTYTVPQVKVADAMKEAGFDPNKAWNIFLLVAGKPKQQIDANFMVDLRTPGIEKIRLMQRNVDNGDGQQLKLRREFDLLAVDKRYLDGTGLRWETIFCGEKRWLIIHDYPLLSKYSPATCKLALNILKDYPTAQIDMFYFSPHVSRRDGIAIPSTQVTATIEGASYQGWSRHRNSSNPWDPYTDNVATHLALVESCLAQEVGE